MMVMAYAKTLLAWLREQNDDGGEFQQPQVQGSAD